MMELLVKSEEKTSTSAHYLTIVSQEMRRESLAPPRDT